ncbi:hypothetical protein ACFYPA_06310 [Streptomyces sp. NPDC005775]|uniref:hypothetical protein n=1 Tax=Streptomyces sp. NPDC005775 TaxID=3364729 RepID=UPI00369B2A30
MAVQNSTVERPAPIVQVMSLADTAAHRAASHVRTVVVPEQDTPTPPAEPAARRRFIQQREW